MIFQAHRGVSAENPENTMPAFVAAAQQGYRIIELDVEVTKDLQFVLLHDRTLNRTARLENGTPLAHTVTICDITYEEALQYDVGLWFSPKFKGTRLPLLADVLRFAQQNGLKLKIDHKYQKFTQEQKTALFALLKPYADVACLTCSNMDELESAHRIFPEMHFHYDGAVTAENLEQLRAFLPKEQLTVWLPHKNPSTAWVKIAFANASLAALVKQYASLGMWLLSEPSQLAEAEALGADIIETNGRLKPTGEEAL